MNEHINNAYPIPVRTQKDRNELIARIAEAKRIRKIEVDVVTGHNTVTSMSFNQEEHEKAIRLVQATVECDGKKARAYWFSITGEMIVMYQIGSRFSVKFHLDFA